MRRDTSADSNQGIPPLEAVTCTRRPNNVSMHPACRSPGQRDQDNNKLLESSACGLGEPGRIVEWRAWANQSVGADAFSAGLVGAIHVARRVNRNSARVPSASQMEFTGSIRSACGFVSFQVERPEQGAEWEGVWPVLAGGQ